MKKILSFAIFGGLLGLASAEVDCAKLTLSVKSAIHADQGKILEIVSKEVATSPACACEIVKSAIEISNANAETVALIVETAITAAPEHMRLISQCAIAVAPDAFANVQAVMAKLDPNRGEGDSSSKGSKASKDQVAAIPETPNPLDFPGGSTGGEEGPGPRRPPHDPRYPPSPSTPSNPRFR